MDTHVAFVCAGHYKNCKNWRGNRKSLILQRYEEIQYQVYTSHIDGGTNDLSISNRAHVRGYLIHRNFKKLKFQTCSSSIRCNTLTDFHVTLSVGRGRIYHLSTHIQPTFSFLIKFLINLNDIIPRIKRNVHLNENPFQSPSLRFSPFIVPINGTYTSLIR